MENNRFYILIALIILLGVGIFYANTTIKDGISDIITEKLEEDIRKREETIRILKESMLQHERELIMNDSILNELNIKLMKLMDINEKISKDFKDSQDKIKEYRDIIQDIEQNYSKSEEELIESIKIKTTKP